MEIKIQAQAYSDKIEYGAAEILPYTKDKLFFKALMHLTWCWCVAVACVLIPVLHFILVPAFFFLGIFLAIRTMALKVEIVSGSISCPHCSKLMMLPKAAALWPHTEICQECGSNIRINPI